MQRFIFIGLLMWAMAAHAGVNVITNTAPGATSWPGNPVLSTVSNPASQATVVESFNGGGGNTNLGQTFTIGGSDLTLQTIDLYAGAGTGTGAGTNIVLHLFDLGSQTAPNPSPYTAGADLFNSGNGLSISYAPQATGILEFDFTGADQVTLHAGHMYAFELDGVLNSTPVFWSRGVSDTYAGGAAYRNRSWINLNNARDFAMAVYSSTLVSNPPVSGASAVNWNDVRQRIDGFGGGVVFLNPGSLDPVTDANMDTLYGTANASQLGLTLLRVRIDPMTNWSNALLDGQKAVVRGAQVLATPWTPPPGMKDNTNIVEGSLLPSQYANYASYLNGFAAYMATNGAPLAAVSLQNEPDVTVTYESADWTPAQFQTFCHNNASAITNAPVMMPESFFYDFSMSDPTLNDPVAAANVTYIGGHLYNPAVIQDYANAHNKGKRTWMTEFLVNDQTIGTAIDTAKQVHDCLTIGNMSAYIWWKCLGDANGLVNASGVPQKRGFVLAQFSRFVRPGQVRIGTTYDASAAVTAYKDPVSGSLAIVTINTNLNTDVNETFVLTNVTLTTVTPWITSGSLSLGVQPPVTVSNASFVYTLPAQSVVTFVGQVTSNSPPIIQPIPDQVRDPGVTLTVTNVATDPDAGEQLAFSLLQGPTGSTLNASNGVFSWRPPVSSANTTNSVKVRVSDNGTPVLSATNSFRVLVNPLAAASLSSIGLNAGQVSLGVTGPTGPDYSVLSSTNLLDWRAIFMTNSPQLPFMVFDNATNAAQFYRLQLGP